MNKASSLLGGAMVIAIAVVFVVQFRPGNSAEGGGSSASKCAAEVRGECIEERHFRAAYRLLTPRGASEEALVGMNLRRLAVEGLIDRHLLVEDAKRLGLTVSDEDLSRELASGRARVSIPIENYRRVAQSLNLDDDLIRFLSVRKADGNKFDLKQYTQEVTRLTNLSAAEFRDFQREELLAARVRDLVRARVHVAEAEGKEQFQREKSTATVEFARFERTYFIETVMDDSQEAANAWAAGHQQEVNKLWESRKNQFLPECRVTRHILARVDQRTDPDEAKKAARAKIDAAKQRLDEGEAFADVAKATSDDGSAVRGGELGCVTKGRMVKPFEDALFAAEPGKVTGVVESEFGYHLILVDRVAKGPDAETEGRAQIVRELYLSQESERLAAEGARQVHEAVRGGKSLKDALEVYLEGLPRKPLPKSKRKGDAKPKKDGDKKGDKADGDAAGDAKPADAPQTFTVDTHPERPAVETSTPFNVSGVPFSGVRPGSDAGAKVFQLDKPGAVLGEIVPLYSGYSVVVLKDKQPASDEDWKKGRNDVLTALRLARQDDAVAAYVKALRAAPNTDIKYDTKLFAPPSSTSKGGPPGMPQPGDMPEEPVEP